MGLTVLLGLQDLALELVAWLWGLVGTQVPPVTEGPSPREQQPRAGDVGMEGSRDAVMQECGDTRME